MSSTWIFALLSTLIVSLISFSGVFMLSLKEDKLRKILIYLICFAVGALLGNTFFHLLPEAYFHIPNANLAAWICIGGFLSFFLIDQSLHTHTKSKDKKDEIKSYGYLSLYTDGLHNFTDGILIGAAWLFTPELGLATTIAIVLHEIPQEISDFGILLRAGFSRKRALMYNFIAACTAILGTLLTLMLGEHIQHLSVYILPIAAGGFIYLAAVSLLPEVLKEASKKNLIFHLFVILIGVVLMYYFSLHGGHSHSH